MIRKPCPACHSTGLQPFYRCDRVPVHTTLLMPTRQQALAYPRRDIELAFCRHCGFITNHLFEQGVHEYSPACEESQGCSPTFTAWLDGVVERLLDDEAIRGKTVLEIGCGKGEFLSALCAAGNNHGIGYDPAFVPGRLPHAPGGHVDFVQRNWSARCGTHGADLIVCRHTLEHIPDVLGFLRDLRQAMGESRDTLLFFEVPDTLRILREGAFWDIYYEHCSYFTENSLRGLFTRAGFEVTSDWLDYHGQYAMLLARPAAGPAGPAGGKDPSRHAAEIDRFSRSATAARAGWNARLADYARTGQTVVLWGGGSKAAAFLNQLDEPDVIGKVIDINPHKHHCFIPGTGQEVVGPDWLAREAPRVIILMNPVYRHEVQRYCDENHCAAELLTP